ALVARDAFNGARLWQRPLPDWEPVTRHIKSTPVQLQRRLAAIGETVYCTPGLSAPLTTFDAGSGKLTRKFAGTERTQEFAFDRGVLYAVVGDRMNSYGGGQEYPGFHGTAFPLAVYGKESPNLPNPKCSIVALDADSGRRLWEKSGDDTRGYQAASLAICGDHAVYCMADALVCLDRATGRQLWRAKQTLALGRESGAAPTLVLSDSAVYVADARTLNAYSLKDGSSLWAGRALLNHHKPPNLYLAAGLVWSGTLEGYDPQTGKVVKKLEQQMTGPMGHTRCYKDRITERYYINTATGGSDFLPLDAAGEFPNPWVRGTCATGTTPCNGLLYAPPPACSCCNWVMLNALNALAPEPGLKSSGEPIKIETAARLEKGPAYEEIRNPKSEIRNDDWPTYRHDPGRSGVTKTKAPADLKQSWQTRLSTRASAPVIADGKVFVADIDAHRVCALDAADGRLLWSYTTGGRVDSPPTYYKGLVLFGSHDGWVYCLRASDSTLAWRFRDLPDRLICAYGQLESAWPVCGSVLVKDDVAYFAAGRNSFLDGGIFLYGLDPQTGRVIHQRRMYGPYDAQGHPVITDAKIAGGHQIRGFKADVFSTDGQLLYLRHQAFKPDLTPLDPEEVTRPHLIPSPGFLETIPHHRTYWTIGTTIRYDNALVKGNNPYGDLLVMDGERFYEMRGYTPNRSIAFDPRMKGYTLFAGVYAKPTAGQTEKSEVKKKKAKKRAGKKKRKAAETDDPEPKPDKTTGGSTERWNCGIPLTGKAMVLADDLVFVAGTPTEFPADDLHKAYEGRMGGVLWAASASTGAKAMEHKLAAAPVWDGLAAAQGRLYLSLQDGSVVCMEGK
ncbi:MAG: PQQ-binding-like beta-propeller repeat protein, partial [Verrucomicrobia bacterium]|nr:PQQ-binding-like beta-propeller repeat protein [Verrucomicrobiota bacterium]